MTCLHTAPRIQLFPNLLAAAQCRAIIDAATAHMQPSLGYDFTTGQSLPTHIRTSSSHCDTAGAFHFVTEANLACVSSLRTVTAAHFEPVQITHYLPGQQYQHHWDYFNFPSLDTTHNDRVATCIIYLNTVTEGGHTHFPLLDLHIEPQTGLMLYFDYDHPQPQRHLTKHAGLPPISEPKWIATSWIRSQPWAQS